MLTNAIFVYISPSTRVLSVMSRDVCMMSLSVWCHVNCVRSKDAYKQVAIANDLNFLA